MNKGFQFHMRKLKFQTVTSLHKFSIVSVFVYCDSIFNFGKSQCFKYLLTYHHFKNHLKIFFKKLLLLIS